MPDKLEIRFIEFIDIMDAKSGTVAGYNRAIIDTGDGPKLGRVINLEDMKNSDPPMPFILHKASLPVKPQKLDLTEILMQTDDSRKWLDSLKASWGRWGEIPMDFVVKDIPFDEPAQYVQYAVDFMDKPIWYRPPQGNLDEVPKRARFLDVLPPMKWATGKWMPNLYYNRKVVRADGITESYSLREVTYPHHFGNISHGVLFGELNEKDIERTSSIPFEGGFPRTHFLELCYPTSLREAHKYNPLGIQVVLIKQKRAKKK